MSASPFHAQLRRGVQLLPILKLTSVNVSRRETGYVLVGIAAESVLAAGSLHRIIQRWFHLSQSEVYELMDVVEGGR
jgi:hypothetical protein